MVIDELDISELISYLILSAVPSTAHRVSPMLSFVLTLFRLVLYNDSVLFEDVLDCKFHFLSSKTSLEVKNLAKFVARQGLRQVINPSLDCHVKVSFQSRKAISYTKYTQFLISNPESVISIISQLKF